MEAELKISVSHMILVHEASEGLTVIHEIFITCHMLADFSSSLLTFN